MRIFAALVSLGVISSSAAFAETPPPVVATATVEASTLAEEDDEAQEAKARALDEAYAKESGGIGEPPSYPMKLFETFLVLLAVCFLAYFVLARVLPRLLQLSPAAQRNMTAVAPRGVVEIIDRLPLDPKRAIVVVKVGASHFLVGMTEEQMTMLAKLDDGDIKELPRHEPTPLFGGRFQKVLERRLGKEG